MKKTALFIFILSSTIAFSQSRLEKKAGKDYSAYNFNKSIREYEAVKIKSDKDKRELADAYLKIHNYSKAEFWYADLLTGGKSSKDDSLSYIGVLLNNEKYNNALPLMRAFKKNNPNDLRYDSYLNEENYLAKLAGSGRFTVKNLDINSEQEDFGATYYKDKVVFTSSRVGVVPIQRIWNWNQLPFLDIYSASKDANGELSEVSVFQKSFNKKYHEGPVSFAKNGMLGAFTRNNYDGESSDHTKKLQLYVFEMKDNKWMASNPFPLNDKEYSVGHASFNEDGTVMYFASDMPGGRGGVDLYKITHNSDGTWGKPENLGEKINTAGNEMFPFYHSSGILFYSSDGKSGLGGLDVYVAQITKAGFGKIINAGSPVNSSKDDFSFVLNDGMSQGYFASNREGGKGDDDIYSFVMSKPFVFGKTILGTTKDKEGKIIANAIVTVKDEDGKVVAELKSDDKGNFTFPIEDEQKYTIESKKEGYLDGKQVVDTKGDETEIRTEVKQERIPQLSLIALVTDSKTKEPLKDVKVTITDAFSNTLFAEFVTPSTGDFMKALSGNKIGDKLAYNIKIEKEGYLTKNLVFTKQIENESPIKLHESLDISLSKLEVGLDLAKMIDIKPIYFDLGKSNIRKDAAIELDKIVKVMNEYPNMVVELGSHTDCRSSMESNMKLSDARAKSSAEYIRKKITNPERIYGVGFGETKLLNGCACEGTVKSTCSEADHQMNRRTEFKIMKM